MRLDGWIFDKDSCYFDLSIGFAAEWKAMDMPFAVVDLETTGPSPESGELLEFAAILVDPLGAVTAEFSALVTISDPVPESITSETGITQEDVDRQGRPLSEAMQSFMDFVGLRPVFIHNAPFDLAFLEDASEQAQVSFANQVYDTQIMAILAWSPLDCHCINSLAQHIGAPNTGNRAIEDARAMLAVLLALREEAKNGPSAR